MKQGNSQHKIKKNNNKDYSDPDSDYLFKVFNYKIF